MATKRKKKKEFLVRHGSLYFYADGTYRCNNKGWRKGRYSKWRLRDDRFEWKHESSTKWQSPSIDYLTHTLERNKVIVRKLKQAIATKAFEKEVLGHDKSRKKKG